MNAWIISVVGVIALGILLEVVLPEGSTAKYVKGAFSLIVIFVIVSPIGSFLKKDVKIDFGKEYVVDESYVADACDAYASSLEQSVEALLAQKGIEAEVEICVTTSGIESVTIFSNDTASVEAVSEALGVSRDKIELKNDKNAYMG